MLASTIYCASCPVGYDQSYQEMTYIFDYDDTFSIETSASQIAYNTDNLYVEVPIKDPDGTSQYVVLSKRDYKFEVVWNKTLGVTSISRHADVDTYKTLILNTNSEYLVYTATESGGDMFICLLNETDGTFLTGASKTYNVVEYLSYITFNSNNNYLYAIGKSGTDHGVLAYFATYTSGLYRLVQLNSMDYYEFSGTQYTFLSLSMIKSFSSNGQPQNSLMISMYDPAGPDRPPIFAKFSHNTVTGILTSAAVLEVENALGTTTSSSCNSIYINSINELMIICTLNPSYVLFDRIDRATFLPLTTGFMIDSSATSDIEYSSPKIVYQSTLKYVYLMVTFYNSTSTSTSTAIEVYSIDAETFIARYTQTDDFKAQYVTIVNGLFYILGNVNALECAVFKKTNLYVANSFTTGNDNNLPFEYTSTSEFTEMTSLQYNLTSGTIDSTHDTLDSTGTTSTVTLTSASANTEEECDSFTDQYTSDVVYSRAIGVRTIIQAGKSKSHRIYEPCIDSSNTAITYTASDSSVGSYTSPYFTITGPTSSTTSVHSVLLVGTYTDSVTINIAIPYSIITYTCSVSNCDTCSYTATNKCTSCDSGYSLNIYKTECIEDPSTTVVAITTATVALSSASVAISGASSATSVSTPQGMWSLINQFQIFLTLLMVGWYTSPDVRGYIEAFKLSAFSFEFLHFDKIPIYGDIYQTLGKTEYADSLITVGMESESTIVNHFGLISVLLIIMIVHLLYIPFSKCLKGLISSKCVITIVDKIYSLLTFAVYIRILAEAFLFVFMSCLFEIKAFNTNTKISTISLVLVFPITLGLLVYAGYSVINFYKYRNTENDDLDPRCEEFYNSLKSNKIGKIYFTMFILRRVMIVLIVLPEDSFPVLLKGILFTIVQMIASIYMFFRPFKSVKDNLIEGINDFLIFVLCCTLCICYKKEYWSQTLSDTIVWTLITNGFLVNIVMLLDIAVQMAIFIKKKACKKSVKARVEPEPPKISRTKRQKLESKSSPNSSKSSSSKLDKTGDVSDNSHYASNMAISRMTTRHKDYLNEEVKSQIELKEDFEAIFKNTLGKMD